ncbi:hypothetical protein SIN8267_00317 [Sinobacterium norvegicum]|uniref:Lipoprotein n=1 Tax=Sinobacterium norvegicum TaxID=1641715 RepID=A0ABM9AAI9_9GAMM|nr:DUF6279 family lipoprotein [Sinobacterium norvegicum]CAH0990225.1 hypothetical protein SIN8267_00317 [Sinobacterium norvegicum]
MTNSRARLWLLICTLMIVLSGCTTKFTYRFLDWMVAWSVDDYIDWDKSQQRQFDAMVDRQLLWHQRTQLPRYGQLLRQLQQDNQQPLNREDAEQRLLQMGVMVKDLLLHISPDAAILLASLSDQQVTELLANIDAKTAESEAKYSHSTKKQLDQERVKEANKAAKRLMGRLSEPQRALIDRWNQQLQPTWSEWIASRTYWRDQFAVVLKQRQQPGFEQKILRLFTQSQDDWSAEYAAIIEANTNAGIDLIIALQASASDKQLKHIDRQLGAWAKAFEELAASAADDG